MERVFASGRPHAATRSSAMHGPAASRVVCAPIVRQWRLSFDSGNCSATLSTIASALICSRARIDNVDPQPAGTALRDHHQEAGTMHTTGDINQVIRRPPGAVGFPTHRRGGPWRKPAMPRRPTVSICPRPTGTSCAPCRAISRVTRPAPASTFGICTTPWASGFTRSGGFGSSTSFSRVGPWRRVAGSPAWRRRPSRGTADSAALPDRRAAWGKDQRISTPASRRNCAHSSVNGAPPRAQYGWPPGPPVHSWPRPATSRQRTRSASLLR